MVWILMCPLAQAGVGEGVYREALQLIRGLYLQPETLDSQRMMESAVGELAEEVHWLLWEPAPGGVRLRHGSGVELGVVTCDGLDHLPDALRQVELRVGGAGYPLGNTDVRLELLRGLTDALDRYSRVLHGERWTRFQVRLKGTQVGIGANLVVRDGRLVIQSLVTGGPSELAGLKVGDVLVRIDDRSTLSMPESEASRLVRGEEGTIVNVTVRRGDADESISLTRAEMIVPNVHHDVLEGQVGYVKITHISQRTVHNLVNALEELRTMGALSRGLVLDLRGNTGGSMKDAARSADEFVHEGLLLRTEGPDGGRVQNLQSRMDAVAVGTEPEVPLVVLVDDRTASGAEILAGVLLELDRAALVGTRTYGKGTVQKTYPLGSVETQLKLTVAQYVLANDRYIKDMGIVPDVVVGRIELHEDGVRYSGWDESWVRTPWDQITPWVVERPSWRGREVDERDLPLEIARRAVLEADGPHRESVVKVLPKVAKGLTVEQDGQLVSAFAHRDIDWTPAPAESSFMTARVRLSAEKVPGRKGAYEVHVQVTNLGEEPLHQALVQLDCPTFRPWSGLVLPIGRVDGGASGSSSGFVYLSQGIFEREDEVTVRLRADGRPPLVAGTEVLTAVSPALPRVALSARLVPHENGQHRAEVTVENLAGYPVTGVEVAFSYPSGVDIELLDQSARASVLPPHGKTRFDLAMALGKEAPKVLPLRINVESDRFDLAHWPLELPTDGTAIALREPTIQARRPIPTSASVGSLPLRLHVSDERAVQNVVVMANGRKVAWAGGGKTSLELEAQVDLFRGSNRIVVMAEDDQGVQSSALYVVRGEPIVAVDAADQ